MTNRKSCYRRIALGFTLLLLTNSATVFSYTESSAETEGSAGTVSSADKVADVEKPELNAGHISDTLYIIEADIIDKRFLLAHLDGYLAQLPQFTAWAKDCSNDASADLNETGQRLEQLGDPVENEPVDTSFARRNLLDTQAKLEATLSNCRAILVRSDAAITAIGDFRKENLQQQSLARGPHIGNVTREASASIGNWGFTLLTIIASHQYLHALNDQHILTLLGITLLSLLIAQLVRATLRHRIRNISRIHQDTPLATIGTGGRALFALAVTTCRYSFAMAVSLGIGVYLHVTTSELVPRPLLTIIWNGLPLLTLAFATTFFSFKALADLGLYDNISPGALRSLRRRFNILALVWFSGSLLFNTIFAHSLPEAALFLARAILGTVLVLNVIWIIWLARSPNSAKPYVLLRVLTSVILVVALIVELTGYRNLSGYILRSIVGTMVVLVWFKVAALLFNKALREFNRGETTWQRRIRQVLGVQDDAAIPGYLWIKLVGGVTLLLLCSVTLLYVWQVPEAEIKLLSSYFTQGFKVGTIEVVPSKILEALLALIALLAANSWLQNHLARDWLTLTSIERGARESIATITNYLGIALALIAALAVVGMDFSKLAIIAGALSVGIGFGLQNIVNNFVSGLILLFERPIKTGDWIVAGGVEGNVKKISIRSTLIESFDHADIIVPNSELISGNLVNRVHRSTSGRISIAIGVAYGSDTGRVRDLLVDVARQHPETIQGSNNMHDPKALFLSFGDSALIFELRFFVRDIRDKLDILSDTHFAIDQAFREAGIEIPFPQRDVHLKSDGPGAD